MSSQILLPLLAALLLATTGCSLEKRDRVDGVLPAATAATVSDATGGHELHQMFEAEKRNAAYTPLPDQF